MRLRNAVYPDKKISFPEFLVVNPRSNQSRRVQDGLRPVRWAHYGLDTPEWPKWLNRIRAKPMSSREGGKRFYDAGRRCEPR